MGRMVGYGNFVYEALEEWEQLPEGWRLKE